MKDRPQEWRSHRRLAVAAGVVLGLSAVVPFAALQPAEVAARAGGGSCRQHSSLTQPPSHVRVLKVQTGRVVRVPFREYVITVMGKEWPSYLPDELLRAGAVATAQYAWYHITHSNRRSSNGTCFDVKDSTGDQLYKPERARVKAAHYDAVADVWGVTLRKNGRFIMTGYRRGGKHACGRDANGWKLYARSAVRCAEKGHGWRQILKTYYGPSMQLVNDSGARSTSRAQTSAQRSSTSTPTAQPRLLDDRHRRISWRGGWQRIRAPRAHADTLSYSGITGATASFRFVGRSLELIGRRGPGLGKVRVFVNGNRKGTIDLYSARKQSQAAFFSWDWRRSRARTVVLQVVGTRDRPRVDIDAIVFTP